MTQAIEEFGPDLAEAIPETFDVCGDCGTPTIQLSSHTCPDSDTVDEPTREDLNARIDNDSYPAQETVLVIETTGQRSYAYHETNENDNPLCPVNHDGLKELARTEAQRQRYAPCQFCHRIRDANQEVTGQ
ncbi:hypothetical protein [Halorussus sp. MSC15.2]|uniref:hypothetical protein n=1 Tax=Halorussus sp. MSC15.2 TaxID=2283638 RepID=UPI0013D0CC64|nr:hypothetical protein [Halorussus sp. MSC15.2]NEU58721.1 hypothetical protein [Halorussus sp. MSC15.2]